VLTGLSNKALLKGTTMRKLASALALVLLVGGVAIAQPAKGNTNAKVKVYDFSGDTIEGDLVKPEGTDLNARDFAKHSSLIRIRKDFIPEIIKSAEDL
jgi:rhamnose utilization protein RhaD (predicted bifunctional aldolase and dehydrogenase)